MLRRAARALKAGLDLIELTGPERPGDVEAAQGHRVAARLALDLQRALEPDQIGGRANVLRGHSASICH